MALLLLQHLKSDSIAITAVITIIVIVVSGAVRDFCAYWLSFKLAEIENPSSQHKKGTTTTNELVKNYLFPRTDPIKIAKEMTLWQDRKNHRATKKGIVNIESEFPGWESGTHWTGNSYDALDKLAGQNVNLICVEMPFGNYMPGDGHILKRNKGRQTGYSCGENRICHCSYETKKEILEFHKNWNELTKSYKDSLEAIENYPDLKHVLERQIPEFRWIDDLTREFHFSSKIISRLLSPQRFFRAKNNVQYNSILYDYCEGAACSILRMHFILEKVQKIRRDDGHVFFVLR